MIFNKLNFNQLEQIKNLENDIFKENGYNITELQSFNTNSSIYFCLNTVNSYIIGYAIFLMDNKLIEIYKIAVNRNNWKKNIGTQIINEIKTFKKNILIEVSDKDDTVSFYKKNGFTLITTRQNYYMDNSNALIMKWIVTK